MSDVAGTLLGLALSVGLAVVVFLLYRRRENEDDKRIADLIAGNKAAPRPGMGTRDDALLRRAEERARLRRAP